MTTTNLARVGALTLLGAALLLAGGLGSAAPNLHSEVRESAAARVTVTGPGAGTYEEGTAVTISWTKTVSSSDVKVALWRATASGLRDSKVLDIAVPAAAELSATGGKFKWTVPSTVSTGSYLIVVHIGTDMAWGEPFTLKKKEAVLGPAQLGAAGTVVRATVDSGGAVGAIAMEGGTSGELVWGREKCPTLAGGLPGAFALMATHRAEIRPRFQTLSLDGVPQYRCLTGLEVIAPPAAAADGAAVAPGLVAPPPAAP